MQKKYGVWGLGIVGKSVLSFLHKQGYQLSVMDKRAPTEDEYHYLRSLGVTYFPQTGKDTFFSINDYIIPSPGVSLAGAEAFKHKMIEELDLFADAWKNKIIAVTGTVGKTSTVHLLDQFLKAHDISVTTGGNIGTAMLDLVETPADYALLELSSFQLERSIRFAPDIAIWTNLYPNHLDRHGDMKSYFDAKYTLFKHQKADQKALISLDLKKQLRAVTDRPFSFFSTRYEIVDGLDTLYTIDDNYLIKKTATTEHKLLPIAALPAFSYKENWLIIAATCDMLGLAIDETTFSHLTLPAHRLEHLGAIKGITFYNDSKSTILEATLAAVESLQQANIHLFLGGISKGVDRAALISSFKGKVSSITCFGIEAEMLYNACLKNNIPAYSFKTLEEAFSSCVLKAKKDDIILFSPSGASYDQYKDYIQRGNVFKELVKRWESREF